MAEKKGFDKEAYFKKYGHDVAEVQANQLDELPYPKPIQKPVSRYQLVYENFNNSIEPIYFWALNQAKDMGFAQIDKITDLFTASEQSSFFGAGQQKLGMQQDRVVQFLKLIFDMVKGLFAYVRELRVLDERLTLYDNTKDKGIKGDNSEIVLKGLWVDLVEGGARNPGSVIGLSREVGFVVLPDLFFRTRMKPDDTEEDFAKRVYQLEFNEKVKEVLARKLTAYYNWKIKTDKELRTRRNFLLKYLRQYYYTVRLYMNWVKPYLKNVQRLGMDVNRTNSAELIAAFEGSMVEIEILCRKMPPDNTKYYSCLLLTFEYRTRPAMSFATPEYQRGPIHVGEAKITWRSYRWTEKDIQNFKQLKSQEDLDLLGSIDESIKEALSSVGDALKEYLEEAEGKAKEEPKEEKKPMISALFEPLTSAFKGFAEIPKAFMWGKAQSKDADELPPDKKKAEEDAAEKDARKMLWTHYKFFKKAHGMVTW
ncbi:hypothetical protein HY642_04795 [Candidatus Woesearchaeota archaeon]|nr:hypothetical protein [Candidatus Woesearchaeota archaeon]